MKLTLRLVAGAWCLLGFFWINAYSSVLISFITAPKYVPLVDSVQELVDSSRARPVVVYGYPPDSIISVRVTSGVSAWNTQLLLLTMVEELFGTIDGQTQRENEPRPPFTMQ